MWNELINQGINVLVVYGADILMPLMVAAAVGGVALRWLIYFTVKCEYTFALEFEKRVFKHMAERDATPPESVPFHRLIKQILERTFHEHFELKRKYKRRRFDHITSVTDRLFLIEIGAQRLVKDTLSQTKYLKKGGRDPKFLDISKYVFNANPVFNRLLGLVPVSTFHEIINILPGLFVVGGIFGTFLGTMQALPGLSQIDISNVETTKKIMDVFLIKMAYSMGTSVLGIVLSVGMTMLNTIFSPEGMYVNMVNKFTSSLEFLWNESETNELTAADYEELADKRDPRESKSEKRRVSAERPAFGTDAQKDQVASAPFVAVPRNERTVDNTPSRSAQANATAPAPAPDPVPTSARTTSVQSSSRPPVLRKPATQVDTVEAPRPNRKQLEIKLKIVEKAIETLAHRREKMGEENYESEKARLERERKRIAQLLSDGQQKAA